MAVVRAQFEYTMDQNQLHPRNTPFFSAWMSFTETFASGMTWPYALIAQPGPNATFADAAAMITSVCGSSWFVVPGGVAFFWFATPI